MAVRTTFNTEAELSGPWLLDQPALVALGSIFSDELARREAIENRGFLEAVQDAFAEKQRYVRRELTADEKSKVELQVRERRADQAPKSTFRFDLKDGRSLSASALAELLDSPELRNGRVASCSFSVVSDWASNASLEIRPSGSGAIRVPGQDPKGAALYSRLEQWVESHGPSPLMKVWWNWSWASWAILIVTLFFGAALVDNTKSFWRAEAAALLDGGITQDEERHALQLLLNVATEQSSPRTPEARRWLLWMLVGGLTLCAVLNIKPKLVIGIGKASWRLRAWQVWIRFVFVTAPAFVLLNVLWPWFTDAF